jgi:mannosyltransferase PIG-V
VNSLQARTRIGAVLAERLAPRADAERTVAVREVWRALWSSRLLVWAAAIVTILALGPGPHRHAFDPPGLTRGLGWLGDLLAAPAARWDAAWYLVIADHGYRPEFGAFTASRTAFFPLYPLGVRAIAELGAPLVLAGVLLSLAALAVGLYGLHRLTALEAGPRVAGLAVLLTALSPMAFYFSAVYSESLYLALSVWVFLCARRGQWGRAAALGALAGATRNTGVLLMLPLALLYLYGPRQDRAPDRHPAQGLLDEGPLGEVRTHSLAERARRLLTGLRPRYRLRTDAFWLALVPPVGLGLYVAHLALAGGDPLSPFHAQTVWGRHFAGPYGGIWDGAKAAFEGARQLLSFQRRHLYFPASGASPFILAGHNLMLFGFLLAALPALAGALRRLPFAYGAYVLAALALPLSYPVASQPLMSLPRFLLVLFPLNMWFAAWLVGRGGRRAAAVALGVSAAAMCLFVAQFATWHWVA